MSAGAGAGALLGVLVGVGVIIALSGFRAHRRPRLADRLAVRERRSTAEQAGPLAILIDILGGSITGMLRRGSTVDPSPPGPRDEQVRRRLRRAGLPGDVARHRLDQLVWAGGGVGAGLLLSIVLLARGGQVNVVAAALLCGVTAVAALIVHDRRLSGLARRRAARMDQQLPTVAELLAFAVAAGEPPLAALQRIATTVEGDLADECAETVADVRGGESFLVALRALGERSASAAVGRFVDGITVASERGTPMAEVLRAQAADARAAGHRQLMESSAKREVLMLTPVVFLVLPIVVIIALFPGIHGLNLTVP